MRKLYLILFLIFVSCEFELPSFSPMYNGGEERAEIKLYVTNTTAYSVQLSHYSETLHDNIFLSISPYEMAEKIIYNTNDYISFSCYTEGKFLTCEKIDTNYYLIKD